MQTSSFRADNFHLQPTRLGLHIRHSCSYLSQSAAIDETVGIMTLVADIWEAFHLRRDRKRRDSSRNSEMMELLFLCSVCISALSSLTKGFADFLVGNGGYRSADGTDIKTPRKAPSETTTTHPPITTTTTATPISIATSSPRLTPDYPSPQTLVILLSKLTLQFKIYITLTLQNENHSPFLLTFLTSSVAAALLHNSPSLTY